MGYLLQLIMDISIFCYRTARLVNRHQRDAGQSSETTEMDGSSDFQDAAAAREVVMNDHSYHISSPTKLSIKINKIVIYENLTQLVC